MVVRVKRSVQGGGTYEYLQIVESVRDGDRVRQRVVANLGRRDRLVGEGALDGLLVSLAKFSERLRVVEKVRTEGIEAHSARSWGPALVFDRLWREQGLPAVLRAVPARRQFTFDLERVAFALALQRLVGPGSDLQGSCWLRTVECPGFEAICARRAVSLGRSARAHGSSRRRRNSRSAREASARGIAAALAVAHAGGHDATHALGVASG